jgi:hypothetical protein
LLAPTRREKRELARKAVVNLIVDVVDNDEDVDEQNCLTR